MTRRRFRVAPGAIQGEAVALPSAEAHHVRVMRLAAGANVELFDGAGVVGAGQIIDPAAEPVIVRIIDVGGEAGESPVRTTLIQAVPVKPQRLDVTVRLATELGVTRVMPIISARGQMPAGGLAALQRRAERWQRVAETAAKQCGRSVVPAIDQPVPLGELDWDRVPSPRFLLDPGGDAPLTAALTAERAGECALIVGPEGGWEPGEITAFEGRGAVGVTLGPRVLRADSAGPAALALIQAAWGDLSPG